MTEGFVYVMVNSAFRGLVKIGGTERDPNTRAAELQSTGVPHPFTVVHTERVKNWMQVEYLLHRHFSKKRVSKDREFFRITVKDAILALEEISKPYLMDDSMYLSELAKAKTELESRLINEKARVVTIPELNWVYKVETICSGCQRDYSCTIRRPEVFVLCPRCGRKSVLKIIWG